MASIHVNDTIIELDPDGFLREPNQWNEAAAAVLAKGEGIENLTEDHWKIINYLREYYREAGAAPKIRILCNETGFRLSQLYQLFPTGPAMGACKVAGLPKPLGCD